MRFTLFAALLVSICVGVAWGVPEAPVFDPPSGVYPDVAATNLTLSAPGCRIYFTRDGSRPTLSNYAGYFDNVGNVSIQNGRDDGPNAISRIETASTGDAYDPWYAPAEAPRTIPVIRAIAVDATNGTSEIVSASYVLGDMAVRYGTTPIFSVQAEWFDLFDRNPGGGIYVIENIADKRKVENCYVEMFEHGLRQLARWIELRIQGTSTATRPKKSLRLTGYATQNPNPASGSKWKKQPFDYPFFPGKSNTIYSTIVLRLGGNDWNKTLVRDMVAQAIGKHTLVDVQYASACVVFINGVYWGVHEIRERWEDGYFQYQHGGLLGEDEGEYTLLEYGSDPDPAVDVGWEDEDNTAVRDFQDILQILRGWNNNLSIANRYQQITNRVNPDSNMQHFGASLFTGNFDWPQNNQRFWRTFGTGIGKGGDPLNDGRWNWTFHDVDFAFTLPFEYVPDYASGLYSAYDAYLAITTNNRVGTFYEDTARIFKSFLSNEGFRNRYLNFVYLHLSTACSSPVTLSVLEDHVAMIREAGMDENGLRWRQPHNEAFWDAQVADIRDYLLARPEAFAWQTRRRFMQNDYAFDVGPNRTVVLDRKGSGEIGLAGFELTPGKLPGLDTLPFTAPFPQNIPITLKAKPAAGAQFIGWYSTSSNLPAEPAAPSAWDVAANYASWEANQPASLGSGWGNWIIGKDAFWNQDAGVYVGRSLMPIHGRSENGNSFALYGHSDNGVHVRRELDQGGTLAIGQTMSLDVDFGLSGDNGGAGVAFITANDSSRPVELILSHGDAWGEAFRLYLNEQPYLLENFPHIVGAPIQIALTRTGANAYTLRLIRAGLTYATEVSIASPITGIRLYKQSYGDSDETYNLYFDNLRVAADSFEGGEAAATDAIPTVLFYRDGWSYDDAEWDFNSSGYGGSWLNNNPLSNVGIPCFGLWANHGGSMWIARQFGFTLDTNMVLSFDLQHNALLDANASVGVDLLTGGGGQWNQQAFNLQAQYGMPEYMVYVGNTSNATGVALTQTGIHVSIRPLDANTLELVINGQTNTVSANSAITGIRFYNSTAGEGTECDVFFNNVLIVGYTGEEVVEPLPGGVVFSATGDDYANWACTSTDAYNAGSGGEASALFDGTNTIFFYADYGATADGVREFPNNVHFDAGYELSFQFVHGGLPNPGSSIGWNLYDASGEIYYFLAGSGAATYIANGNDSGVSVTAGEIHTVRIEFSSATAAAIYLDDVLVDTTTFSGEPRRLRFWNNNGGPDEINNLLVNHITITAPVNTNAPSGTAIQSIGGAIAQDAGETLLSTASVYSFIPSNSISILARFTTVSTNQTDYEIWAEANNIQDLEGCDTNGISFMECYLLETNQLSTLHTTDGGLYQIHIEQDDHGISHGIEVTTDIIDTNSWRNPAAGELVPVSTGVYRVEATNDIFFIRLNLIPITLTE